MKISLLIVSIVALAVGASAAGGYALGRHVNVQPGGSATFLPSGGDRGLVHWRCNNEARITCFNGDAFPWVQLTATRRGGITVRVHTLRDPQAGRLVRRDEGGHPVYVFSAFDR